FKENFKMVEMVRTKLQNYSVDQYKVEERSIVAKRIISSGRRIKRLISISKSDTISLEPHIERLKMQIYEMTKDLNFKKCETMGDILSEALDFVKRNYQDVSMRQIIEKKF
ncbi:MAG: hypothetical protein HKP38_11305, partial [Croceitalea sp.]|nr:hypothetical protein [Croceitalea sp.]